MGKKSRKKMTGLTLKERIWRSGLSKKEKEEMDTWHVT